MSGRDMYFSVDVETDGDAPGVSSMLSIGIIALDPQTQEECGTFYRVLKRLPEAQPKNATMEFWDQFPEQWVEARRDPVDPKQAMEELVDWVAEMGKQAKRRYNMEKGPIPVFVAYPAGFDFSFVYYYLHRFLGESVFSFSALDIKSFAMGLLNSGFTEVKKERYPREWDSHNPNPHHALEDARHQADIFRRMLKWRKAREFYTPATETADRHVPPSKVERELCESCGNGTKLDVNELCDDCGRRG